MFERLPAGHGIAQFDGASALWSVLDLKRRVVDLKALGEAVREPATYGVAVRPGLDEDMGR